MVIEKGSFKASRFDSEFSPRSRDSMSTEDEEFRDETVEVRLNLMARMMMMILMIVIQGQDRTTLICWN